MTIERSSHPPKEIEIDRRYASQEVICRHPLLKTELTKQLAGRRFLPKRFLTFTKFAQQLLSLRLLIADLATVPARR